MAELKIGVSSLFAISRGFSFLLRRLEPRVNELDALEVIDEGATRLSEARLRKLSDLARTIGIELSLHAPFIDINIASVSPFMRRAALKHLSRSLERAARLECAVWVVHGGGYPHLKLKARAYEKSLASLNKLASQAADFGLRVALENYPAIEGLLYTSAEEVARAVREGLHESIGICLDLGHANTAHQVQEFMKLIGSSVIHVHAHDNDGLSDLHLAPGDGTIDWDEVLGQLKRASFSGTLVLETQAEPWEGLSRIRERLIR
ncbi:MAG: sugar phosphate isomerase/epimerase [Candidatus Nezhaarchaeota archaeon]|nr:sugar phosphate isomerase/epimerase [Candidatus Nezhaarchaeota archaeon]